MIYGTEQFSVDSHGAYVVRLVDGGGSPVLFEQTEIDGKRRGGAHVCLPYFGPDAAGARPQHGFGRDVEWSVEAAHGSEIRCTYKEESDELFGGLHAELTYRLGEAGDSFTTVLAIANHGKKSFSLTPGFHPYFAVDPKDVRLNGENVDLADFEPFKSFPGTPQMTIESGGRVVTVSSQDLPYMVAWTNLQGDYLCVEPTLMGNAFDSTKQEGAVLQPGASSAYTYIVHWN